jgi:Tfp pilus assembly protein PilO
MSTTESKLWCSRQQLWVCAIALLFVGDFVFCGYIPSENRLQALERARVLQENVIRMAAAQSEELPKLRRRLQDTSRVVERYETYVPTEGTLGTFLQQLAGTMTARHLTDQVVVPGKEWVSEGVTCIPVHMTCSGGLIDVFGFFNDLQALDRLVRIGQVTLTNDSSFTGRLSLEIEATIFYQVPKQGRAGDSAGAPSASGANHGT